MIFLLFNLLLHGVVWVRDSLQGIPFRFEFGGFSSRVLQICTGIVRNSLAHGRELGWAGSFEFVHRGHRFILRFIAGGRRIRGSLLPGRVTSWGGLCENACGWE